MIVLVDKRERLGLLSKKELTNLFYLILSYLILSGCTPAPIPRLPTDE